MQCTYKLGATARLTMTTRGSGIQVPTVRARRLRCNKPTQAHGPWLTNPAAPAQANGRQSGCHFCILPRRGSLLEPAAELPGPVDLVVAGHVCDVHEHVSCVQHAFACRCA